jgi:hypothetical protein
MTIRILAVFLVLSLPGCATLERHPVLTAVGAAILAGSIAAVAQHHHDQQHFREIERSRGPQIRVPDGCCGIDCPNRSNAVVGSCVGR